jgi:hypothetical protein
MKIKNSIINWWKHPARWYQFWLPQSGLFGGLIIGATGTIALVIIVLFIYGVK